MAEWWETDPDELEKQRKKMEAINAANPGGEDTSKSFVEGGSTGGWLKGVGETLEAGRSTTAADRDRYIAEARAAGASDEYMDDFLQRNPGDFSRLKRVWMDETVDQPDSNNPDVDPNENYNYTPADEWNQQSSSSSSTSTPTTDWSTPTAPPPSTSGSTEDWRTYTPPARSTDTDWRSWTPATATSVPYTPTPPRTAVNPLPREPAAPQSQAAPITMPAPVVRTPDPTTERTREALVTSQAQDAARSDALWKTLEGRAGQSLAIDRNDPIIRAQADAYGANESRASDEYLADLAEGSSPNANLLGEQRLAAERQGQRKGAFEAELMGRELSARRDEIAGALAGQGAMLTADQQRSLTRELALMDNAIKENQLNLTQRGQDIDFTLGKGRIDLDAELGRGNLALDTELGRGRLDLDTRLGDERTALDRDRLGLDTELGRGRLTNEQNALEQEWRRTLMDDEHFGASQAQDWKKALMADEQFEEGQAQDWRGQLMQNEQFGRGLDQDWRKALMSNEQFLKRLGLDASEFASNDDFRRSYV